MDDISKSLSAALVAARAAGPRILDIYQSTFSVEYKDVVRFALVDADESPQTVNRYGILSLPSYLIFRNGRLTDRFIGVRTKEKFSERIEESLKWV